MSKKSNTKTPKTDLSEKIFFAAKKAYKWWNRIALLNEYDPFLIIFIKIMIRLFGIIIIVLLSPIAIIGLIIGISAVL